MAVRLFHRRPDSSLAVFPCTPREAAEVDIRHGPFAQRTGPRGGRVRPLASVHSQLYGDTFQHLSALYTVLTGRPHSEALEDLRIQPPGSLARVSEPFVAALSAIAPPQREGQDLWAEHQTLAERWFKAVKWRRDMQIGGLTMRIFTISYACRRASDKGLQAWAWTGPRVPEYVIVSGVGQESYEAYRRGKK